MMKANKNSINKDKKEVISYIITGIATTLIQIVSYRFLLWFGVDYIIANFISLVLTKFSAYILNKWFVFYTAGLSFLDTIKEFIRFFIARSATGLLDFFGLILLVEVFKFPQIQSKYFLVALVIILNYIFSKLFVFKKTQVNKVTKNI